MLTAAQTREVRRLLRHTRLSQRAIAAQTGVSRATVAALTVRPSPEGSDDAEAAPPRRCRRCGSWVHPPCRVCKGRRRAKRRRLSRQFEAIRHEPLGLELRLAHAARYQHVHRQMLERRVRELEEAERLEREETLKAEMRVQSVKGEKGVKGEKSVKAEAVREYEST